MRLKWVLQMCIFVLKNSIKGYLSHFKNNKKIYVHTSPPRWYWVSPSRAFSRGCGRFGDCVWQTDSGLSEGWTSAQRESVWIAGCCYTVLTIPSALWWKKNLLLLLATFRKLDQWCELWSKHPEKKTDVDMWINFDPSHMRPDLKGWSNSPDYKQKMRNPVIFTLLGDCSAFGLDQVHQHKDKRKRKRHGQRQGQRQWQKRDIDGGRDKDKNRVTFTHLGDCSQLRLIQVPKPDEGDYRRALEDLARDAAGVCTPNRHWHKGRYCQGTQ